jgi:hypothetical protein
MQFCALFILFLGVILTEFDATSKTDEIHSSFEPEVSALADALN